MTEGFLFGSQIAAAGVRVLLGLVLAVRLLSAEKRYNGFSGQSHRKTVSSDLACCFAGPDVLS